MNTIGTAGKSNIEAIIYNKKATRCSGDFP
jgi:hypothetical protein